MRHELPGSIFSPRLPEEALQRADCRTGARLGITSKDWPSGVGVDRAAVRLTHSLTTELGNLPVCLLLDEQQAKA